MTLRTVFAASLLFSTPLLFAQQPPPPAGATPPPSGQQHDKMHHPGNHAVTQRSADQREEMQEERMDLGELGLPMGNFWLDPNLAARISLTQDQIRRLADTDLQGQLKSIQLEADLEMEQARLDAMETTATMDSAAALALTDRIADARAAIEKADAHNAFALRAILTPSQLTMLKTMPMYGGMERGPGMQGGGRGQQPMQDQMPPA